jgi:3-phenylpropionate/trans-cinnamate dioxygenase ferredoxin subunit
VSSTAREGTRSVHDLGPIEEFPEGSTRILDIDGVSVGVFNVDGVLYAVRNLCPHHGAPVCMGRISGAFIPSEPDEYVYGLQGQVLRCPWHGWEFDLKTGRCLFGVDRAAVRTYPVTVEEGQVIVEAATTARRA